MIKISLVILDDKRVANLIEYQQQQQKRKYRETQKRRQKELNIRKKEV